MSSFEMTYDAETDVLEALFYQFDANNAEYLDLNDSITIYMAPGEFTILGINFAHYGRLLGVSETEFTGLRGFNEQDVAQIIMQLSLSPVSCFFDITDPEGLIARVLAPTIEQIIADETD